MFKRMILLLMVLGLLSADAFAQSKKPKYVIKIGSLAPQGSTWDKSFEKTNREIRRATDGEVAFRIYPGGVMGDEPAMVRKMRTGQLDGAGVTNVGLGEIEPQLLVLQLPLTFRNEAELDYVRDQMSDTLQKLLDDKGFVLLHWGDVGFNYVFSNVEVATPSDFKKTKMWVWDADPISKAVMEGSGVSGVLMGVTEVLSSLQTGIVDAYSNSPYGAVALQWHTRAKYVTNLKLAVVVGGLVVSKKSFEALPENHRKTILEISERNGKELLKDIRKDNQSAMKTIEKAGIKVVAPQNMNEWMSMAQKTKATLTGKVFPKELVDEVERHLNTYRKK